MLFARLALASALALGVSQGASAVAIEDFGFQISVDGVVVQDGLEGLPTQEVYDPTYRTWGYVLTAPVDGGTFTIDTWSAVYDTDPFVTNNIALTNNSLVAQTFIISVAIPIPAFAYDQAIANSVGITATDSNGNGLLSVTSAALAEGQVNGTTVLSMLDPLSLTQANCSFVGPGCTAIAVENVPSQLLPAGSATLLGLKLTFTLSPGDSVGITSRFEIVPEPGTALLVGLGALGLGLVRRRS
jgi:hypothetical protein